MELSLTVLVLICGLDAASGQYTADCGGFERRVATVADCARVHRELRESAPANIHVGRYECFREGPRVARVRQ